MEEGISEVAVVELVTPGVDEEEATEVVDDEDAGTEELLLLPGGGGTYPQGSRD